MKAFLIREVTFDQLDECSEVIRQGFATVAEDFGLTVENCPTHGTFIKTERLQRDMNKGKFMYSLTVENRIVGFMQLEKLTEEQFELQKFTVLPAYRHYGYGKELLNFAKNKVKQLHGSKLTLGIIEENTILKDWYGNNGFVHTGTEKSDHLPFTAGYMEYEVE